MESLHLVGFGIILSLHGMQSAVPKTDITVVLPSPIYVDTSSSEDTYINGYLAVPYQSSNYTIGRETDTGPGDVGEPIVNPPDNHLIDNPSFPIGSKVSYNTTAAYKQMELMLHGSQDNTERIGAFFVEGVTPGGEPEKIIAVKTSVAATISFSYPSKTVSIGDSFTIEVFTSVAKDLLRWTHNGQYLPAWDGLKSVILSNIRNGDRGIYECYQIDHRGDGLQAIMNLIVKACSMSKYGLNCENRCGSCYNGGVCDDESGACICRPGFMGENCEIGCGSSMFGATCSISCEGGVDCMGNQFCAPDPVGCSCITGYNGKLCDTECSGSTFGANCEMTCHCQSCDNQRGCSGGCIDGYTGDLCQEPAVCPEDTFGSLCQYDCHCAGGTYCDRLSGICGNGQCAPGWGGNDCQQALPALYNAPNTVVDNDAASIIVSWSNWNKEIDYGTGPVTAYIFHYGKGVIEHSKQTSDTTETVTDLLRGPSYVFAISVLGIDGREGFQSPLAAARIQCTEPSLAPSITNLEMDTISADISWSIPAVDDWINCETGVASFTIYFNDNNVTVDQSRRSATISGLLPCTKYEFKITVDNEDYSGPFSLPEIGTTDNAKPDKIDSMIITTTPNTLHVSWDEPPIASPCPVTGYSLSYRLIELDQCERLNGELKETSVVSSEYTITGLEEHSTYEVYLAAYSGAAFGDHMYDSGQTDENVPTGPPIDIVSDANVKKQLSLSWYIPACGDRNGYITLYEYLFGEDIDNGKPISGSTEPSNPTATFTGLQHYANYEFKVRARTSIGPGPFSDTIVVQTAESNPTAPPEDVLPIIDCNSPGQVGFSWKTPPKEEQNGVIILYEYEFSSHQTVSKNSVNNGTTYETSISFSDLPHNTLYQFRVRAYTMDGAGPFSDFTLTETLPRDAFEDKIKTGLWCLGMFFLAAIIIFSIAIWLICKDLKKLTKKHQNTKKLNELTKEHQNTIKDLKELTKEHKNTRQVLDELINDLNIWKAQLQMQTNNSYM